MTLIQCLPSSHHFLQSATSRGKCTWLQQHLKMWSAILAHVSRRRETSHNFFSNPIISKICAHQVLFWSVNYYTIYRYLLGASSECITLCMIKALNPVGWTHSHSLTHAHTHTHTHTHTNCLMLASQANHILILHTFYRTGYTIWLTKILVIFL
jgi:hypothetical protein